MNYQPRSTNPYIMEKKLNECVGGGGLDPSVLEEIEDSLNSINDKLTLKELASVTTASGKTFQNALLELKTTWNTLPIAEKVNTTLYYDNNILYPNTTSGIYSRVTLSASALVVIVLNISSGKALFYNGGTITDKTNDTLDANLSLKGF